MCCMAVSLQELFREKNSTLTPAGTSLCTSRLLLTDEAAFLDLYQQVPCTSSTFVSLSELSSAVELEAGF